VLPPVAAIDIEPLLFVMVIPDPCVNVVRVYPVPLPTNNWPAVGVLPKPVPPLATDKAVPSVNPAKVGEEEVAIPWIVLTAPFVTVRLVELNEAKPLTVVLASWIVIVPVVVTMLDGVMEARVTAPD
jgi:hypothetical protein